MTGYLKPYRSYVFRTKDPVIDTIRTAVQDSGLSYTDISADSGVSAGTLTNWFTGSTRRPQFATVNAIARSLGKEFVLVDRKYVVRKSGKQAPHLKVVARRG